MCTSISFFKSVPTLIRMRSFITNSVQSNLEQLTRTEFVMKLLILISVGTLLKNEMEVHMKIHLRKMLNATKVEKKPNLKERRKHILNKSMCPQCGKFYYSSAHLEHHIRRVHLKQKHIFCDLCG